MKKFFAILMAVLMAVSMFAACSSSGNDAEVEGNVLKIGMTGPLTGPYAEYGTAVEASIEIAVEEINAAAEANGGLKLAFKSEDDEGDGEKAVAGYNRLKDWAWTLSSAPLPPAHATLLLPRLSMTASSC